MKQLFHPRLLDMNLALTPPLATYLSCDIQRAREIVNLPSSAFSVWLGYNYTRFRWD